MIHSLNVLHPHLVDKILFYSLVIKITNIFFLIMWKWILPVNIFNKNDNSSITVIYLKLFP